MTKVVLEINDDQKVELIVNLLNEFPYISIKDDNETRRGKRQWLMLDHPVFLEGFTKFSREELNPFKPE